MPSIWVSYIFVFSLILGKVWSGPALYHDPDSHPLSAVSDIGSRLAAHAQEARLPLPTPQELEAIKKVAQILIMLGEQVIPAIIGDTPSGSGNCDSPVPEVPVDNVNENSA